MRARLILAWAIFLLAVALLVVGVWPKLQGGHFRRDAVYAGGLLFVMAAVTMRRNRRRAARGD